MQLIINIIIVLFIQESIYSLSNWSANITIVKANCQSVTFQVNCPISNSKRYLEFHFYRISNGKEKPLMIHTKECDSSISKTIKVKFQLECKSLYRISTSVGPDSSLRCDELCSSIQFSPTWLLGEKYCEMDLVNDCLYDKYKHSNNKCGTSATICNSSNIKPFPTLIQRYNKWSPNITITKSDCENIVVRATCPRLHSSRTMELYLYNIIEGKEILMTNIDRICSKMEAKEVQVEFSISCKSFYRIKISLSPNNHLFCDIFCSKPHFSPKFVLGTLICDGKANIGKTEDCNGEIIKDNKKRIVNVVHQSKSTLQFTLIIVLILFIPSIIIAIYLYIIYYWKTQFRYRRKDVQSLIINSSDVL